MKVKVQYVILCMCDATPRNANADVSVLFLIRLLFMMLANRSYVSQEFRTYQIALFQLHKLGCAHVLVHVVVVGEYAFAVD
jgi:hypothetical protein